MSCGLNFLREGARNFCIKSPCPDKKLPQSPAPNPSPHFPVGAHLGGRPGRTHGAAPPPGWEGAPGREPGPLTQSPWPSPQNLAYGLDFGSRYVKLVYPRGSGGWGRRKMDSIVFYRDYLVRVEGAVRIDWPRLGLPPPEALVATGYGKDLLKTHFPTITEIRAHFLGARFITGLDHFILLEMGGQDTKVLYIRGGRVFDFLTNDRCAAGTGRYLENMARFLKMPLTQFAGCWQDPVDISQTCAIFGETELVGHLLEGVEPARIAAGVNASVARRALAMVRRYRCPTLVFAGGVAKNRGVVKLLKDQGIFQVKVPPSPQFNGALGAALEAGRVPARERP
jgi:(R)-2-hydroxyacyl-CoA dehydratese activating ATPase